MDIKMFKMFHATISSNTKSNIDHQFSRLLQEDKKIVHDIFGDPIKIYKCNKNLRGVVSEAMCFILVSKYRMKIRKIIIYS